MAKATIAFTDSRGRLHSSAHKATVSDLAALFGWTEGMSLGIAQSVLEKRAEIEQIFAELDAVQGVLLEG